MAGTEELTRAEYLHLLDTARVLGREPAYLLVKVFALTGISVSELPVLTVEAVRAGRVRDVPLPEGLKSELLAYAARKNILSGPVFATRSGRPLDVQRVSAILRGLGAGPRPCSGCIWRRGRRPRPWPPARRSGS